MKILLGSSQTSVYCQMSYKNIFTFQSIWILELRKGWPLLLLYFQAVALHIPTLQELLRQVHYMFILGLIGCSCRQERAFIPGSRSQRKKNRYLSIWNTSSHFQRGFFASWQPLLSCVHRGTFN